MYRYISRESCSQFDSLPLTYLTSSRAHVHRAALQKVRSAVAAAPSSAFAPAAASPPLLPWPVAPTHFFVASNAARHKETIVSAFAEAHVEMRPIARVHTIESLLRASSGAGGDAGGVPEFSATWRSDVRSAPGGIELALIEWLVLAQSAALMIHPYRSSFAAEAAAMHRVPALQLVDGAAVLGIDTNGASRCHCNSIRFAVEEKTLRNARSVPDEAQAQAQRDALLARSGADAAAAATNTADESAAEETIELAIYDGALRAAWGVPRIRKIAPAFCDAV